MDLDEEGLEYGEDGIPVLIIDDVPPVSRTNSKHPRAKKKKPKPPKPEPEDTEGERHFPEHQERQYEEDAKAVFNIDGEGYDVVLSENRGQLLWSAMNALGKKKKSGRKLSGVLKGRRPSVSEESGYDAISLDSLYAAHVKKRRKPGEKEDEGICEGIVLSLLDIRNENTLKDKTVFMEHPSDEVCTIWSNRIMAYLKDRHKRPESIKLFLQPYAGAKTGRNVYSKTLAPLFQAAGISVDVCEVAHNEYVKQEMVHLNLEDYDCIACMGGDGTVQQVVNGLMNKVQRDRCIDMKQTVNPARSHVPLGIIPTGRTNTIAQTLMGVADPVTAVLHIIHGHFQPVDICSIYKPDKFLQWGFTCQYGFAGNVLTFMRRYKSLGSRRLNAAFIKALTKAKLRAYECDIEYIPSGVSMKTKAANTPCRTGCKICHTNSKYEDDSVVVQSDMVQELDLNESFNSTASSVIDLPSDSPWVSLKGKYMNVGVFAISGISDITPQGFSPNVHLNDGTLDLVLVKETGRKEYIRHLRRHGNSKDQFDFPFVEIIKVKDVRFRPRFPLGWNYKDYEYSEIQYQMDRTESQATNHKSDSVEVIADLESDDEIKSITTLSDDGDKEDGKKTPAEQPRYVGPQYRKTFYEIEMAKRKKHDKKKQEKQKAKEESKMVAGWNIDNQMVSDLELDIRVHHGLLQICGLGVSPLTQFEDLRFGCLAPM